jgi:hypothetical protein
MSVIQPAPMNPITLSFIQAADRLQFQFEPAFVALLQGGGVLNTLGLVREFGSRVGTLLFSESAPPSLEEQVALETSGYYFSLLFPSYAEYDETLFKETLNDWRHYGQESSRPTWYSGESWSESA